MATSGEHYHDSFRTVAYEALADEIISGIPALAEKCGLSPSRVALTVWHALFFDLIGGDANGPLADELFELARRAVYVSPEDLM